MDAMSPITADAQAQTIEQLIRDNVELRRRLERLTDRIERLEVQQSQSRTHRPAMTSYGDPLGR